jgi:hypothetical protein
MPVDGDELRRLWMGWEIDLRKSMNEGEIELDVNEFSLICDLIVHSLQRMGLCEKAAVRFMVLLVKTIYTTDYGWFLYSENSVWEKRWRKWDNPKTRGDVGFGAFLMYLTRDKPELPVKRFFIANVRGDGGCLIHAINLQMILWGLVKKGEGGVFQSAMQMWKDVFRMNPDVVEHQNTEEGQTCVSFLTDGPDAVFGNTIPLYDMRNVFTKLGFQVVVVEKGEVGDEFAGSQEFDADKYVAGALERDQSVIFGAGNVVVYILHTHDHFWTMIPEHLIHDATWENKKMFADYVEAMFLREGNPWPGDAGWEEFFPNLRNLVKDFMTNC